nr:mitochondrial cardiolipin hydrolase [Camelus bactrianus]
MTAFCSTFVNSPFPKDIEATSICAEAGWQHTQVTEGPLPCRLCVQSPTWRGPPLIRPRVTCTEALLQAPGATLSGCPCSLPHCESSLSRLLRALLAARASLELCLFAFSSPQLGRAVQLLHQRGVRVRVVTDCDYMALNGSQIGLLRKAGIQVRHDQDLGYMHHKFAIVDKKVLITGSLNWTTQAIQNNRENVLILEDEEYVRLFLEEFERIWEEFNPTKYTFFPKKSRR